MLSILCFIVCHRNCEGINNREREAQTELFIECASIVGVDFSKYFLISI